VENVDKFYKELVSSGKELMSSRGLHRSDHVLFLSHYKVEAGTEAALILSEAKAILESFTIGFKGFDAPIFLDSEDLKDLSALQDHVRRSYNIVLLLTPKVLHRPWILVELATALESNIPIVPVEICRPGIKFLFPTEEYYRKLADETLLGEEGTVVMRDAGVNLGLLERGLRAVFKKIAIRYSPHRPAHIRKAEIDCLLRVCRLNDGLSSDGPDQQLVLD